MILLFLFFLFISSHWDLGFWNSFFNCMSSPFLFINFFRSLSNAAASSHGFSLPGYTERDEAELKLRGPQGKQENTGGKGLFFHSKQLLPLWKLLCVFTSVLQKNLAVLHSWVPEQRPVVHSLWVSTAHPYPRRPQPHPELASPSLPAFVVLTLSFFVVVVIFGEGSVSKMSWSV